jgi:hypothetical protein
MLGCKDEEPYSFDVPELPLAISSDDMANEGDTVYLASDESPNDEAGGPGEDQNWDFSNLEEDDDNTIYFVQPSEYSYGVDFPTANLAYEQEGDITVFLKKSSERLEVVGLYGDLTGEGIIVGVNYEPSQLFNSFPFVYQDSYNDTSGFNKEMAIADIPELQDLAFIADSFRIKQQNILITNIDASGSITTPLGAFECLREYREETVTDSIFAHFLAGGWMLVPYIPGYFEYENPQIFTSKKYIWYTNELKYPIAEAILDSNGIVSQINYLSKK